MRLTKIMIGAAALAALSGCNPGGPGGYPENSRQAFVTSCKTSGAPGQICECALKKIEAKFTFAEFTAWDTALQQGREHPMSSQAITIMGECAADYMKSGGQ